MKIEVLEPVFFFNVGYFDLCFYHTNNLKGKTEMIRVNSAATELKSKLFSLMFNFPLHRTIVQNLI